MDQPHAAIIAATIAAISSSAVSIVLVISGLIERRGDRKRETMLKALEHLTGGAQKRSVGIALIEGLWYKGHPFHRAILPALVNQAVYLLFETERGDRRHQIHNWIRIMHLIFRVPYDKEFHDLYCELADALEMRCEENQMPDSGIQIPPPTSKLWLEQLKTHAHLRSANSRLR
jgi:hypothetical protein